jgi:hypothetical protein
MTQRAYEVRVSGHIPAAVLHELGDVHGTDQESRTVVSASFPDQAALYGFLHRIRAFGLDIVEVRRIQSVDQEDTPDTDEVRNDPERPVIG